MSGPYVATLNLTVNAPSQVLNISAATPSKTLTMAVAGVQGSPSLYTSLLGTANEIIVTLSGPGGSVATFSTPQPIATTSSPSFAALTINSGATGQPVQIYTGATQQGVAISGAAATARGVLYETAGSLRWFTSVNQTAESGSNVGSDYGIFAYSDTGTYLGNPLLVNRATGTLSIQPYAGSTAVLTLTGIATGTTVGSQTVYSTFTTNDANADSLIISNTRTIAGTTWTSAGSRLQQKVDATWMGYIQFNNGDATTANNDGISFGTGTTTLAPTSIPERMRIDAAGNVMIGTTAQSGSALLTVNGTASATTFAGSGASLTSIPNSALTNSSVTVNGTSIALGASGTVTAAAGTLTGTTLNSTVTASSLTSVGTLTSMTTSGAINAASTGTNVTHAISSSVQSNPSTGNFLTGSYLDLGGAGGNYLALGQYASGTNQYAQWIQSGFPTAPVYYNIVLNPLGGSVYLGPNVNATNAGTLTATSFSGAGTGLTGTATSLSIGGSAPAGSLTGTTLNSTVTASSLTSVGTLGALTVSGAAIFNGVAEFTANIAPGLPLTTSVGGGSIAWNHTSGQGEVNFFNNYWTAGTSFTWLQQTAASTVTQLMSLSSTGLTVAGGGASITGKVSTTATSTSGALFVKGTGTQTGPVVEVQLDDNAGSATALYVHNLTNFAQAGTLVQLSMVNGTDGGAVLKLANAGTGNYLTCDSVASITKVGVVSGKSFTSTVATGTAPLTVTSTTQVANLNAATAGTATNVSGGAAGSVLYQSAAGATTTLPIGSTGQLLTVVAGVPGWTSPSLTTATNIAGGAAGSLPYQTAASTTALLPASTNGYILTLVSGLPAWAAAPVGTSITGTANQISASASTGAVTLSLPTNVVISAPSSGQTLSVTGLSAATSAANLNPAVYIASGNAYSAASPTYSTCLYLQQAAGAAYGNNGAALMLGAINNNNNGPSGAPIAGIHINDQNVGGQLFGHD